MFSRKGCVRKVYATMATILAFETVILTVTKSQHDSVLNSRKVTMAVCPGKTLI